MGGRNFAYIWQPNNLTKYCSFFPPFYNVQIIFLYLLRDIKWKFLKIHLGYAAVSLFAICFIILGVDPWTLLRIFLTRWNIHTALCLDMPVQSLWLSYNRYINVMFMLYLSRMNKIQLILIQWVFSWNGSLFAP